MPIQAIDKGSIHRLTSGQVITDLSTAVKELVDNALDAKATSVDIRLSDYGSSLVEVSDNGAGIAPADRPLLARKYHTSKISNFDDLETLTTLGFRGEALSSLCAVSHVSVVTKMAEEACGVKLEYDEHGELSGETMVARSVGTTVSVRDLFHSLPVRRKEFEKNLKRDYGRLVSLLQSYALIRTDVRFVCTNQVGTGARSVVVQSAVPSVSRAGEVPSSTISQLKESARSVLGKKVADGMLAVHKRDGELGVEVFGVVSGAGSGVPKGRGDARHFYVNARPIAFKKAGSIFYETYKNFVSPTHTQRPACVLDFRVSADRVDVNVTPDKRTVFFQDEAAICRFFQNCLVEVWEAERGKYTVGTVVTGVRDGREARETKQGWSPQLEFSQAATSMPPGTRSQLRDSPAVATLASAVHDEHELERGRAGKVDGRIDHIFAPQPHTRQEPVVCADAGVEKISLRQNPRVSLSTQPTVPQKRKIDTDTAHDARGGGDIEQERVVTAVAVASRPVKPQKAAPSLFDFALRRDNADYILHGSRQTHEHDGTLTDVPRNGDEKVAEGRKTAEDQGEDQDMTAGDAEEGKDPCDPQRDAEEETRRDAAPVNEEPVAREHAEKLAVRSPSDVEGPKVAEEVFLDETGPLPPTITSIRPSPQPSVDPGLDVESAEDITLSVDMDSIRSKFAERARREKERESSVARTPVFMAATVGRTAAGAEADAQSMASDGEDDAEKELKRVFQKEQFKEMEVIGQFNLGFIIAKLGDDLFIIDQHASDEKHTFENLQRNTRFHKQRLICPIVLEDLTPRDREIVEDNLAVFSNSGFEFDQGKEGTLRLVAVPHCKGMTFNSADVMEMIGMIDRGERSLWHLEATGNGGSEHHAVYPSRFRALLASKACRTSIMIGKALTKNKMKEILSNLSTLVSPWNCPHGRPTMRHLASLSLVASASHPPQTMK